MQTILALHAFADDAGEPPRKRHDIVTHRFEAGTAVDLIKRLIAALGPDPCGWTETEEGQILVGPYLARRFIGAPSGVRGWSGGTGVLRSIDLILLVGERGRQLGCGVRERVFDGGQQFCYGSTLFAG